MLILPKTKILPLQHLTAVFDQVSGELCALVKLTHKINLLKQCYRTLAGEDRTQ